jgi:DNA-binding transcriptional LysR family regulator
MDLNLLSALDALLQERSVTGAARRMNLSVPAMSRTLTRIRDTIGDPVLVRAGRRLVPTPHALAMATRVREIVADARALLLPGAMRTAKAQQRIFTIRSNDTLQGIFAARLLAAVKEEMPGVTLRFVPEGEEDVESLRDGRIDLDIGLAENLGPEIKVQSLFRNRFVAVVRRGHPILRRADSLEQFLQFPHVGVSRRGKIHGPMDEVLARRKLSRHVALVVSSFHGALAAASASDLIACVPEAFASLARRRFGIVTFPAPVPLPGKMIAQIWHPRLDADRSHAQLRALLRAVATEALSKSPL